MVSGFGRVLGDERRGQEHHSSSLAPQRRHRGPASLVRIVVEHRGHVQGAGGSHDQAFNISPQIDGGAPRGHVRSAGREPALTLAV